MVAPLTPNLLYCLGAVSRLPPGLSALCVRPGGLGVCPLVVGMLCAAPARRLGLARPACVHRGAKTHKYAQCCAIVAWDPAAKLDFPSSIPRFFPFPSPAHPRASNAPIPVKKVQHGMENPYFPGMRRLLHCGCSVEFSNPSGDDSHQPSEEHHLVVRVTIILRERPATGLLIINNLVNTAVAPAALSICAVFRFGSF